MYIEGSRIPKLPKWHI